MQKKMEKLVRDIQEIYFYQRDSKYVQDKLTELEDRSHRNNVRIDGIKETKGRRGLTANKKTRICLHGNWGWKVLKLSVHIESNITTETVILKGLEQLW